MSSSGVEQSTQDRPHTAKEPIEPARVDRVILLLAWGGFLSMAFQRVCDAMLPQLSATFQVTSGQAAYSIAGFAIAYGAMQLVFGPLGDRFGKLHVIAWATISTTFTSIGTALVDSFALLIVLRVLTGVTVAGIVPLAMAWIGDTVSYEHRQATLARFLTGTTLGMVGGQVIGGAFADTIGWQWAFVALAALSALVGVRLLHWARRFERHTHADSSVPLSARASIERYLSVARLPWARVVLVVAAVEGLILFGGWAFVPTYLHDRFGLSLTAAGAVASVFGLGGLAYTLVARRLVMALQERGLVAAGGALLCVAFTMITFGPTWLWTVPASFIAGLGLYMMHATLQTHATQMAPQMRGTAVSLFSFSILAGQSIGVAGASSLIDHVGAFWLFAAAAIALPLLGWWFARALRKRSD